jgi:GntR family transcriptional regulator
MVREAPYLEVADDLRSRITSGEWAEGDRMPSHTQLAREYGVGRNVTQRAVDRLIIDGLLEGRAGSGTFVRQPRERRRMIRSRNRDNRDESPFRVGFHELSGVANYESHTAARTPAPANIASRLGIAEGDRCVRTSYEFMVDLQPVQLTESWEPMAITDETPIAFPEMGPLAGKGVVARMRNLGIEVVRAVEVPRPARATAAEGALLGIIPGDLVLHIERTYYDSADRAVETADITVPDLRWEIAYEIGTHGG